MLASEIAKLLETTPPIDHGTEVDRMAAACIRDLLAIAKWSNDLREAERVLPTSLLAHDGMRRNLDFALAHCRQKGWL
jgi:hypothetical protein